jgi:acyl-CoA synthetase (AMP-forming)/AMP-acid ligase II
MVSISVACQLKGKDSFLETRFIPEHFIFFKDLPHTHNGKLDRKATALKIRAFVSMSAG